MPITTVSVSFANGFVGNAVRNNEAGNASLTSSLGWSKLQFEQATDNGQFGGAQGNDLSGTILVTDAAGVQHRIEGVINWRAPSGTVSTMVFYAKGSGHTLATTGGGTYYIDPWTEANGDARSFVGLTFNGQALSISNGAVSGNAATQGLLSALNTYLNNQPKLTVGDATVDEGAGTATVTVTLSRTTTDTVTVRYTSADGTATAGSDYAAVTGTLTFAPGETTKTITVPVTDTAAIDGARNASIILSDSTFAAITDNTGVVTINDNDATVPVPATVASVVAEDGAYPGAMPVDSTVGEGGSLVYTVVLSGTGGEHSLVRGGTAATADLGTLAFSDGVAWKNGNPASGIVVVPNGVGSFKVTLPTADDSAIETTETAVLTVGDVSATGTITDNDSQSVATVIAEDAAHTGATPVDNAVIEGAALVYTVALNSASPAAVEYSLALGGTAAPGDLGTLSFSDGVTWKNGNPASGTVVVPAGVAAFTVTLPTVDDALVENAESAMLAVGGVSATGTITDNDSRSITAIVAEDAANIGANPVDSAVVEGHTLRYTVSMNAAGVTDGEYALTLSGSAATADLGAIAFSNGVTWKNGDPATGIVIVPAAVTSFTVDVATSDDTLVETAETVVITLGGIVASGTVTDNDAPAIATVVAFDATQPASGATSVTEGVALAYAVTLNTAGVSPVEFTLALGGTAAVGDLGSLSFSDGVTWKNGNPASGTVVVPTGVAAFTVTLPTVDDVLVESAESAVLAVGGVSATGTISDNDSRSITAVVAEDAANIGANPVDSAVVEGHTLRYTVSMNAAGVTDGEYALTLSGSAATADLGTIAFSNGVTWKNGDPASGIVIVPAAVTSFTVDVATSDDTLVETAETVVITLGGIVASGTVTDNDAPAIATVVAFDAAQPASGATSVTEGAALAYAVTLNTAGVSPVEFTLALGGTASSGDLGSLSFSDGVTWKNGNPASGTVVVPAGVAAFTVTLPTVDDALVESAESAVLAVGGVSATGTITDNDSRSITAIVAEDAANIGANPVDSAVVEGNTLRYTVSMNAAGVTDGEYALTLSGSAATADLGAIAFSNGVTWKNGDPAMGIVIVPAAVTSFTVDVATSDDTVVETAETVVITLGGIVASG
ncbi:beta strand repeat-containing protein, partial [Pseudoduganella umbonata]